MPFSTMSARESANGPGSETSRTDIAKMAAPAMMSRRASASTPLRMSPRSLAASSRRFSSTRTPASCRTTRTSRNFRVCSHFAHQSGSSGSRGGSCEQSNRAVHQRADLIRDRALGAEFGVDVRALFDVEYGIDRVVDECVPSTATDGRWLDVLLPHAWLWRRWTCPRTPFLPTVAWSRPVLRRRLQGFAAGPGGAEFRNLWTFWANPLRYRCDGRYILSRL